MRKLIHFRAFTFAFIFSGLLVSCANMQSSPSNSANGRIVKSPRVLEVERKMREKEESQQDSRDRDRVLAKKNKSGSDSFKIHSHPQSQTISVNPVPLIPNSHLTDQQLYSELVGSYDRNNEIAFFSRLQAFQQTYSKSPLADDALYLAGLMSLSNKNYGPALKYFNQVLQQFPTSNKASSALFAKAATLKKMNLLQESQKVFLTVEKRYPGSPEALRTEAELKTLNR